MSREERSKKMSKFCGNCGKELDDNTVFCTNCGNKIEHNDIQEVKEENIPKKSNSTLKIVIVTIIISIVLTIGLFAGIIGMIGLGINNISNKVNNYKETEKIRIEGFVANKEFIKISQKKRLQGRNRQKC